MKLDFGCGAGVKKNYEGVDCADTGSHVKHVIDLTRKLPWKDCTVEAIHANHILEHMPYWRVRVIIFEWCRVLVPGGLVEIAGPDILKIMHWVREDYRRLLEVQVDILGTHDTKYANDIGVPDPGRHRVALCGPLVVRYLQAAGIFANVIDFEKTVRTFRVRGNKSSHVKKTEYLRNLRNLKDFPWPDIDQYEDELWTGRNTR